MHNIQNWNNVLCEFVLQHHSLFEVFRDSVMSKLSYMLSGLSNFCFNLLRTFRILKVTFILKGKTLFSISLFVGRQNETFYDANCHKMTTSSKVVGLDTPKIFCFVCLIFDQFVFFYIMFIDLKNHPLKRFLSSHSLFPKFVRVTVTVCNISTM